MIQYFAVSTPVQINATLIGRYKNALISYWFYKGAVKKLIDNNLFYFDNLIMDSGAFSAHNSGEVIHLNSYCNDLKSIGIQKYFSLDVIGSAEKSYENYKIMRKMGMNPIPTFHINTDIEYLLKYLSETDHISIGNMVQGNQIVGNLDKIWNEIYTRNPNCKVHGLGVSNYDIASRYPWHSIDSSSYNAITKFSRAALWNKKKNNFDVTDTFDLLQSRLSYNPKSERSGSGLDGMCFVIQQEQYNMMIDSINEYQKEKNFNYLTAQTKLF